ncbi:MAG TPA: LysR substrate-binding domain-containing protein [Solirubrobacteraceae bacterium]|nr:LysR substrate-binding domain-containing protein [Solirubrobacteraceae bacterium]
MTDLRRLRYFLAVAQERNFTRAAERLHIAQPALSRQVKLLEQELGVELLHRTTHDFELTDAGTFLVERGPTLLSAAEELWRSVRTYGAGERGEVIVAYSASTSYETAPLLLKEVVERLPGIALNTALKSLSEIIAGVADGSFDVGLVRCAPQATNIEARIVRLERQGVLLRRDHRLATSSCVPLTELAHEILLLHSREANPGHYDAVVDACTAQGFHPKILLRTISFDLAHSPVVDGQGIAIMGESSQSGLSDDLVWLPLSPDIAFDVSLLTRRHRHSPAVERLLAAAGEIAVELEWL